MGSQKSYRAELDGIRAFCILFTVGNHLPGGPAYINGSVGVDIFFALSGWLITTLLLEEQGRTGRVDFAGFYIRRFFRIVPLYALTIVLYGLASVAVFTALHDESELANFRGAILYLLTFNGEYIPASVGNLFGHSWTLGIEEKFYLLWPAVMLVLPRRPVTVMLFVLALIVSLVVLAEHWSLVLRGYAGLGFGSVLALAAARRSVVFTVVSGWQPAYYAFGAICLFYAGLVIYPHDFIWNVLISASASVLIASLWFNAGKTLLARALALRPIAAVGRLTYAIYLTHVLAMNFVIVALNHTDQSLGWPVLFAITYAASVAVGLALHVAVERPLIEVGRNLARRRARNAMDGRFLRWRLDSR